MATGSEEEIEEERRLFYVALTRARDFLEVCFPLKYYQQEVRHGRPALATPSSPAFCPRRCSVTSSE